MPRESSSNSHKSADKYPADSVFQIGEELVYNVSYMSIDIGQIRVKQVEEINKNNQKNYKVVAYIDSYRGIPFVNLHSVFESIMHPDVYSLVFHSRDKENNHWKLYVYNFDYPNHIMRIEESIFGSGKIDKRDSIRVDTLTQDGLSLLFFARKSLFEGKKISIPVVVNEKKFTTEINFTKRFVTGKIDAVDYKIDLVYFDGEAGFVGIFGLTGGFEGWFSNDAARVPIMAKMKVLIGNIYIELMSWKRNGWNPPRYHDDD